ncbi:MAG: hypothetical protein SFX73_01395 [Kofleriaceae bacterium]|nr:hypothetical protein [Kofleriaceae bacterium]
MRSRRPSDLLARIATCELLADELDAGHIGPEVLLEEVSELRAHFDALPPLPSAPGTPSAYRRAPRFSGTVTDELRDTLDRLRDHLGAQALRADDA